MRKRFTDAEPRDKDASELVVSIPSNGKRM
jgi:hypothetical protein